MSGIMKLMESKLGLKDESGTLSKACEFERLLKIKATGGNNLNDYARAVICLDLATDSLGIPFDMELAVKLSALKKSQYANHKHIIKKILDLETGITINSLCVQLGCTQIVSLAKTILEKFKQNNIKICDLDHPQNSCMAVYQACRVEKIKIARNKFVGHSRLKPSQWSELETEWTKMVNVLVTETGVNKKTTKNMSVAQKICDGVEENKHKETDGRYKSSGSEKMEDYETWKARILKEAYKEIEDAKSFTTIKIGKTAGGATPQKLDREKAVRLVFSS